MKRVLFVAQNLEMGGIQTSLLNLLKKIAKNDEYSIDLFVFGRGELLSDLPENVSVIYGKKTLSLMATPFGVVKNSKRFFDILRRIFLIFKVRVVGSEYLYRSVLKKHIWDTEYYAAVSFFNDVPGNYFNQGTNLYVSDFVKAKNKIAWIHTDPQKAGFEKDVCEKTYRKFDRIMCVSKSVKAGFDALLPMYSGKTEVFYNVFDEESIRKGAEEYVPFEKSDKLELVTVCRVDNVSKRINKIVELCKRLKSENVTAFKWRIVGDGPHLEENIRLAEELDVSDLIEFVGKKKNPYPYVKKSDIFALYSAYEGFPMVVGEALALDKKIITTEYAAAREQIPERNGIICKTDEEFYTSLKELIQNNLARL